MLIFYKIEISKAQLTQLGRRLRTAGFNRISAVIKAALETILNRNAVYRYNRN